MFQTSRDQRYEDFADLRAGGAEDDASYFAGLRAQTDESEDWDAPAESSYVAEPSYIG